MKIKTAFFLLCCMLLSCVWCAAEEIVAYVNGRPITEFQLQERLQTSQIVNTYATSEMSQDEKNEIARIAYEAALQVLIREEALLDEADKRGLTPEHPQVQEHADSLYKQMIASAQTYVLSSYPNLNGDELDAQVDVLLGVSGGSRESYRELAQRSSVLAILDETLTAELSKPDEETIQAYYEALYAEQKSLFDQDHNLFEAAMLQGKTVVYRPTDLKLIQKVEFLFDQEALALIRQTAALNPDLAAEMRADQHSLMLPRVERIYQELIAGACSFTDVMENEKAGSSRQYNYFHEASTRFQDDYYSRAKAFQNVGEISTFYEMTTGYAILYYAGHLEACEKVPLAEVREQLIESMIAQNSSEALHQAKEQILSAAEIVICERGSE